MIATAAAETRSVTKSREFTPIVRVPYLKLCDCGQRLAWNTISRGYSKLEKASIFLILRVQCLVTW